MNYFELFNSPAKYDIDLADLSATYQTLQRLTHPDRFANKGEQEKLLAVQKNAELNDAFTTLKSPLLRAEYILQLRGIDLQHEQQTVKDMGFLMQQMEWREQLEDIEQAPEPFDALEQLSDDITEVTTQELTELAIKLNDNIEQSNHEAADLIRKLKFLYKLQSEIEAKEDALDDL